MKNEIAKHPSKNAAELSVKVAAGFAKINSKDSCGVYQHVQKEEGRFVRDLEDSELVDDDVDSSDSE